jgi:ABC-2 type transport system permease protein
MAVYERAWRRYEGPVTPLRTRFLVVTRFALGEVFSSRLFTAFYLLSALPSLLALFLIYLSHNLKLIEQIGLTKEFMGGLTMAFFQLLFSWQAVPAFFIALIVSPSLIAADLSNNALPLYLARPIDRSDYVLGKMAVLFLLLSPVTWIAGLLIFLLQAYLEGGGWWLTNHRIALAYLVGHLSWIVVISLLSLAVSAWVRYKPVARGALFGVLFILSGFSEAVNGITGSSIGDLMNLSKAMVSVVQHLFGGFAPSRLPVIANWTTLIATGVISIWLLNRKLRAHEEVR